MKTMIRHIAECLDSLETCGAYGVTGDVGDLEDAIEAAIKTYTVKSDPKPLAQYLAEYVEHELIDNNDSGSWRELFGQALDAYESTESAVIQIIKKKAR
jgi:hypothetical protein